MRLRDLDVLEDRVNRMLELVEQLHEENRELRRQNSQLLIEIERLQEVRESRSRDGEREPQTEVSPGEWEPVMEVKNKIRQLLTKLEQEELG